MPKPKAYPSLLEGMEILSCAVLPQPEGPYYRIYGPDAFEGHLYLGGWRHPGDIGPDLLYRTGTLLADAPDPVAWHGADPRARFHLNDPSLVRPASTDGIDRGQWTFAFVTALPNEFATATEMTRRNQVGLASSVDGGETWTWRGIVIGQDNGLDEGGAWAPAALATSDRIDLWYHTGGTDPSTGHTAPPRILRTTLDANGWEAQGTAACIRTDTGRALQATNVDVERDAEGTLWMVGQDFGYFARGEIVLYHSQDGLHWTPWREGDPVLIDPAAGTILGTPAIECVGNGRISVLLSQFTGEDAHLGMGEATYLHRWEIALE